MVELFAINIRRGLTAEQYKELSKYVSQERMEKSRRFVKFEDAIRSILAESVARAYICRHLNIRNDQISFVRNDHGKPILGGELAGKLHFNLSHSGDWVFLGASSCEIGVDVEEIRNIDFTIAKRYFSTHECDDLFSILEDLERRDYFYALWSLKESYIKAEGMGFSMPLDSFYITPLDDENYVVKTSDGNLDQRYLLKFYSDVDPNYKFAVCSKETEISEYIEILTIDQVIEVLKYVS